MFWGTLVSYYSVTPWSCCGEDGYVLTEAERNEKNPHCSDISYNAEAQRVWGISLLSICRKEKKAEEKREAFSDEALSASDFPIEQERLKESFISGVLLCDSVDNADYDAPHLRRWGEYPTRKGLRTMGL